MNNFTTVQDFQGRRKNSRTTKFFSRIKVEMARAANGPVFDRAAQVEPAGR